jgi:hypothetical protein
VVVSTIGPISGLKLKIEFNTVSKLMVPELNKFLQKYKVPIPTNIYGIFFLSDLFLEYNDGFIYAGATPTFVAPAPATPVLETVKEVSLRLEQF